MNDDEIIRPSKSPYNSPVIVVSKKNTNEDGTPKHRLCIDFRKLNIKTISDRYPMQDPTQFPKISESCVASWASSDIIKN